MEKSSMSTVPSIAIKCKYCSPYPSHHAANWFGDFLDLFFIYPLTSTVPDRLMPIFDGISQFIVDKIYLNFYIATGIIKKEKDFPLEAMQPFEALFMERARARGAKIEALRGPFGYLHTYRMYLNDRWHNVDSLPVADKNSPIADDKWRMKKIFKKLGYPVAEGRAFWFFQRNSAIKFAEKLQFPVIVKPRKGSLSQHMFLVANRKGISSALNTVAKYSPVFIVEKFISDATLYRATILNNKQIFVVRRLPAAVMGDGVSALEMLAGKIGFKTENLILDVLKNQGIETLESIVPRGKTVALTNKAIFALGSRLEPVPISEIHPAFVEMWFDIARRLNLPLVGIDMLVKDHKVSPDSQTTALLELNTLPNILLHNNEVADALVDSVLASK